MTRDLESLPGIGLGLVGLSGICLGAVWPGVAVLFVALVVICWTTYRDPYAGLWPALTLFFFAGTLKLALAAWGDPLGADAKTVGAAAADLGLAIPVVAILAEDRGRALRTVWESSARWERLAFAAFALWLGISVIQVFVGGLKAGVEGFRLTQMYVILVPVGTILVSARRSPVRPLLWVCLAVCAYAALRVVTGPLEVERAFVLSGDPAALFGETFRAVGSFQSAVGLASFVTPALVFALVVAIRDRANRVLALTVVALAGVGVLASYVRVSLLAIVIATGLALVLGRSRSGRGSALRAVLTTAAVAGAVLTLALVASLSVPYAKDRFESLLSPGNDQSLQDRFNTWEHAFHDFEDQPLGRGLGQVGHATEVDGSRPLVTDNSYLKVLVEQGVLGFLAYVAGVVGMLVVVASRLRRAPPGARTVGVAALAGFVAFLLLGLAGEYVEQPGKALAWLLLGVAIGQAYFGREPASSGPPGLVFRRVALDSRKRRARAAVVAVLLVTGAVATAFTATRHSAFTSSIEAFPVAHGPLGKRSDLSTWRRFARSPSLVTQTHALLPTDSSSEWISGARLEPSNTHPFSFEIIASGNTPERAVLVAAGLGVQLATRSTQTAHGDRPQQMTLGPRQAPEQPTILADKIVNALPGSFPPRPSPLWVVLATVLIVALTCWAWPLVHAPPAETSFPALALKGLRTRLGPGALPLAGACIAAAILLLVLTSGLTFFNDEWDVILNRPGWSPHSLLRPHNEHIYLGPVLIYKVLLEVFGLKSAAPYEVVNVGLVLTVASLVFVYVRRRLGSWVALIGASSLLFLGPAADDLLWPAGISFVGAIAGGVGALVALDRRDRRGDWVACGLLIVSVSFSTLGLMFAVGACVELFLRDRRLSSLRPAAVPVLLYGVWYLAYGREAASAASLHNLLGAPQYLWDSLAAALAGLLGLTSGDPLLWGRPLAVAVAVGSVVLIARDRNVRSPRLWGAVTIAGSFWISAAVNEIPGRGPTEGRYQLIGAVLVILIAAELVRGRYLSRGSLVFAAVVAVGAISSNLLVLKSEANFFRSQTHATTAELSALELTRGKVDPGFLLAQTPGISFVDAVVAGNYFDAIDQWGSPVDPRPDLAAASDSDRQRADAVFASALGLHLEPAPKGLGKSGKCKVARADPGQVALVTLPRGGALLEPAGGILAVHLRRYSQTVYPVDLGTGGKSSLLAIPVDGSKQPWQAEILGSEVTTVCPLP